MKHTLASIKHKFEIFHFPEHQTGHTLHFDSISSPSITATAVMNDDDEVSILGCCPRARATAVMADDEVSSLVTIPARNFLQASKR